jgi:hypothetical protein
MPDRDDRTYFLKRAREERAAADGSRDSGVARIHFRFAEEYERRAERLARVERIELPRLRQ